jgi:hypothetical protein
MLAVAALLFGLAGQQVAYAQLALQIDFDEAMSFGDEIGTVMQQLSLERALVETLGISDALDDGLIEGSPETHSVSISDTITIQEGENVNKQAASSGSGNGGRVARSLSDGLSFEEGLQRDRDRVREEQPPEPRLHARSVSDGFAVEERMFLAGSVVPPSAPELVVSGGRQSFNMESAEAAVITFISSSSGTYRIDIENDAGERVASVSCQMTAGENNARWAGTDLAGKPVTDGTYTYYITANNDVGTRTPPAGGDGTILVSGAPEQEASASVNWMPYMIIVPVLAAAGMGVFLFTRRRNRLVVYLPAGAAPVIDEIRERYPRAEVGEYVDPREGGAEVMKGVAIQSPRSSDEEWFGDIIRRAKELAGVDSINICHKGKVRPV